MLLRTKDKNTLWGIFSTVELPIEVWAYGSRVSGTAHEGSDLDLVIRSQNLKPLPRATYNELRDKIRDSNIPILVELRDWALLPEYFHKSIERQYEVFYSNVEMLVNEPSSEYRKTNLRNNDQ